MTIESVQAIVSGGQQGGKIQLDWGISIRFNGQSVRLEELWIAEDEVDDTY